MTRASSGRPAASGGADGSRRRAARDGLVGAAALALVGLGTALWRLADRPPAQSEVDLRDLDPDPGDASPALDEALARISRAGGGVLHLPPGRWRLSEPLRASVPGLVVRGAGLRATRLVVPEGAAHAAVQVSADGVVLERFTVEGNLASWSGGDGPGLPVGIRVGDSAADVSLRDLVVEQATGYGIGLQRDGDLSGGVFDALVLRDVTVAVSLSGDIRRHTPTRPESEEAGPVVEDVSVDDVAAASLDDDVPLRRRAARLFDWSTVRAMLSRDGDERDPVHDGDDVDALRGSDAADVSRLDVVNLSYEVMQSTLTNYKLAGYRPDVLVEIPKSSARTFDFHRAPELIALGRARTAAALDAAGF